MFTVFKNEPPSHAVLNNSLLSKEMAYRPVNRDWSPVTEVAEFFPVEAGANRSDAAAGVSI